MRPESKHPFLPTPRTLGAGPWKGPYREVGSAQPVEPLLGVVVQQQGDNQR